MILVIGGTGFVGSSIVKRLLQLGERVRVLSRSSTSAHGQVKGVEYLQGDACNMSAVQSALAGANTVINLVGIIRPTKKQSFQRAHVEIVRTIVDAMKAAGVRRLIHMSALGTRPHAPSQYHSTKWAGEELVRQSGLDCTILRPGLIVGKGDGFVSTFVKMMRPPMSTIQFGTIPLFGGGNMTFQPIGVEEVAKCFSRVISQADAVGSTIEICGKEKITLRKMLEEIALAIGGKPSHLSCNPELLPLYLIFAILTKSKPLLFDVPMPFAKVLGLIFEKILPVPPLTYDQVLMLEEGSIGDPRRAETELGVVSRPFSELISYLKDD